MRAVVTILGLATTVAALAWGSIVLVFGSEPGHVYLPIGKLWGPALLAVLALWAVWTAAHAVTSKGAIGGWTARWIVSVPTAMALLVLLTASGLTFRARFELSKPALDELTEVLAQSQAYVLEEDVSDLVGLFWVLTVSGGGEYDGAETRHILGTKLRYAPHRAQDKPFTYSEWTCSYIRDGWWNCGWTGWDLGIPW